MPFVLPSLFARTVREQRFALLSPACGLLRTIVCIAAGQAHWTVPTRWDERCGRPAREDSSGRALGDVGGAITHGRCTASRRITRCALVTRGGQTFPKSTEIRNSVAFRAVFSIFFGPFLSVVAESVSEQLLQRTDGLGGQFWLSKESVSTSATDCRIPTHQVRTPKSPYMQS